MGGVAIWKQLAHVLGEDAEGGEWIDDDEEVDEAEGMGTDSGGEEVLSVWQ